MMTLSSIPDLEPTSLELLEAAGFSDASSLAKASVDDLTQELKRANRILKIAEETPSREQVEQWVHAAREMTGTVVDEETDPAMPVNYELADDVVALLDAAPFAIPLPARFLIHQELAVADIPPAILLNRYSGDLEVRVEERTEERLPSPKPGRSFVPSNNIKIAENQVTRLDIDTSRIKSTDALSGPMPRGTSGKAVQENERVALLRAPREETNKGRNPESRRYIRGVLHSHPFGLSVGAFVTLLLAVFLPLGVIAAVLLLLSQEAPKYFNWVPPWVLVFPLILPLLGIAYLVWGMSGSCRICGQKQFVPRVCIKNRKAHHIRGLGHIIPVALHMLLFRWFRCTYCATPVRLKK
jgi:Domain of unknown function (DUF4332)